MLEPIERGWDGSTTPKSTILSIGATSSWDYIQERAILEELLNTLLRRLLGDYQGLNPSLYLPLASGVAVTLHNIRPNDTSYPTRTPVAAGMGEITPSAYDTAWVARIRNREKVEQLAFPAALKWLLREQAPDGSWSNQPAASNSLLPTLAALMALRSAPEQSEAVSSATHRAEAYLYCALKQWAVPQHESVGFEMAAPTLLAELETQHRLTFEFEGKAQLQALHAQKLKVAGQALLYSGHSNLLHTLEAFGPTLDFARLKPLQAANGSYGCSPAATAAVLIHSPNWDSTAEQWLKQLGAQEEDSSDLALGCSSRDKGGRVPTAYSIDLFERAWVLYNLSVNPRLLRTVSGLGSNSATTSRFSDLRKLVRSLSLSLGSEGKQKGVSISELGGLPADGDDTGMVITALNRLGCSTSVASLFQFEREGHFACFETERDLSVSANAHILAAFLSLNKVPLSLRVIGAGNKKPRQLEVSADEHNRATSKLVNYLYGARHTEGYWLDKWHLSPYYATSCAALALLDHPSLAVRTALMPTLEWLLQTQSEEDGGWGFYGCSTQFNSRSSLEETAYALQVLRVALLELAAALPQLRIALYQRALRRGRAYLWRHLDDIYSSARSKSHGLLPRLWQGKELYTPWRVVEAAILSALY